MGMKWKKKMEKIEKMVEIDQASVLRFWNQLLNRNGVR
jgi:hypothetical protein